MSLTRDNELIPLFVGSSAAPGSCRRPRFFHLLLFISFACFFYLMAASFNGMSGNAILASFGGFFSKDKDEQLDKATTSDATIKKGFLVYSDVCQIPDVNPLDETIADLIKYERPIDCSSDYPKATFSDGKRLYIDKLLRKKNSSEPIQCCYRNIMRKDALSDDKVMVSEDCVPFTSGESIMKEFIKVECSRNGRVQYTNYHAFIHKKLHVEKRCQAPAVQRLNERFAYSVLIVGLDAVSRLNFHRQFPRTLKVLKEQLEAVEMFGYNKVGDNTFPNLIPALTGYFEEELKNVCWPMGRGPLDKCPFIWKEFAKRGYRTLYAEDTPRISTFNYLKEGFYRQPTDYYFRPFISEYERQLGRRKRLNCHECVGPISETEAILHWTKLFVRQFGAGGDTPFFAFTWINSITHDFLNSGSSIDGVYERFLVDLKSGGYLDSTLVIIMSDHGMRWGSIRETFIGKLEERLPAFFIALPASFREKYPEWVASLKQNAHRLTTPFDLHATLEHLLNSSKGLTWAEQEPSSGMGISLFRPVPENRSCSEAGIVEHWCTCQRSEPVARNNSEVVHVSEFLVDSINKLLQKNGSEGRGICAELLLSDIVDARLRSPTAHLKAKNSKLDMFDYTVTVHTEPGGGVFEGTVRFVPKRHTHDLLGDISRLNLYGNQSSCVHESAILRKYCYCKIQEPTASLTLPPSSNSSKRRMHEVT